MHVRLGTFSPSVLLEVAARTGALTAAGLTVQEIAVASSPAQFAALLDGDLDVVVTNPDNVVAYRCLHDNPLHWRGDVRIIAALDRGLGLALYGEPTCPSPEDLAGKVLGVDVATSGFAFVAYELLDRLRVRPYTVLPLGSTPRRAIALLSGRCSVTILNAGNDLRAEAAGAHRLAGVSSLGPYVGAVLAARGETIDRNPDMVGALTRTLLATSAELFEGKHKTLALQAARRRLDLGEADAARYVEIMLDSVEGLTPDGRMTPQDLRTTVALRNRHSPKSQRVTLQAVLDSGICQL
ncbi:MAG: hypothetical protein ABW215_11830 [Kibdelosporangium sp.]